MYLPLNTFQYFPHSFYHIERFLCYWMHKLKGLQMFVISMLEVKEQHIENIRRG
jgi:hypothetical protein